MARDLLIKLGIQRGVCQRRIGARSCSAGRARSRLEKGGWSIFCTGWEGLNLNDPAGHYPLLGNGTAGWFGWPDNPSIEALRTEWYDAPDAAAQKKATDALQAEVWKLVPYIPLGEDFQAIAVRDDITGVLESRFPLFWNVRKT